MTDERKSSRRRRWLWVLAVVVLLLAGAVALLPQIISSSWGEGIVANVAGDALNGRVSLGDLETSWGGPTRVRKFVLSDLQGRPRIALQTVTLTKGVWGLAWKAEHFGELTLDGARVTIWADRPSPLLPPGKEDRPAEPDKPAPLPEPVGTITVRNARVTIVRADGRRYTLGPIEGTVTLRTLNELAVDVDVPTPQGGRLELAANVTGLVRNGQLDPSAASGSASLQTVDGNVAIGPLAAMAGRDDLSGELSLDANATFQRRQAKVNYALATRGLRSTRPGLRDIQPLDALLTGFLAGEGRKGYSGRVALQRRGRQPVATASIRDGRLVIEQRVEAAGSLDVRADLRGVLAMVAPLMGRQEPPAVEGTLAWQADAEPTTRGIRLTGGGELTDFRAGRGKRAIERSRIALDHELTLSRDGQRLQLTRLKLLAPELLTLSVDGNVTELRSRQVADLRGHCEVWWDAVNALAAELAPQAVEQVALRGHHSGPLRVKGPLHQAGVNPFFKGAAGSARIGWQGGEAFGLSLGKADIAASLAEGVLAVPLREIPAGKGKVRVGGTVDFTGDVPVYRLGGEVRPLSNVRITPQLRRELLGRFNPVFMQVAEVDGNVSLRTKDLVVPLDANALARGSGSGRLELSKLHLLPRGLLAKLVPAGLDNRHDPLPVGMNGVDFAVRDGRIHYENFRMSFPRGFALDFSGSAGLDGTLDLAVAVPLTGTLVKRLGLTGKAARYADLLEGVAVRIPIRGTRAKPELDLSAINVDELIKRVTKDLVKQKASDVLRDLLEGDKDDEDETDGDRDGEEEDKEEDDDEPTTRPSEDAEPKATKVIRTIIDILRASQEDGED